MPEQVLQFTLGREHRDRTWSDQGAWEWTFADGTWNGIRPDGTDGGTATEDELNAPGFGPFREVRW